jgi:release factor glutamine methyltransferase
VGQAPERTTAVVAAAARRLAEAGVPSPGTDAELLAAHVLGVPRARLVLAGGMSPAARQRFDRLVADRAARVPLQHLTGVTPFRRLELAVGPGVLVPRPETELLAEWVLEVAPALVAAAAAPVVVDLCSGSGALALAIANESPSAVVYAVEDDPAALGWLRRNAADRAAAGDRPVEVVAGDVTDPAVLRGLDGTVDLVVCNPPYVPEATAVAPEVARHDPPRAVFAGTDGLAVIRAVIRRVGDLLRPGGGLAIEHDDSHRLAAPELLRRDGRFTRIAGHRDLAGRPRFVTAVREGATVRAGASATTAAIEVDRRVAH